MRYQNIWLNFTKTQSDRENQNAERLAALFNGYSEFKLDTTAAKQILATSLNPYYHQGHSTLGAPQASTINDFSAF